MSLQYIYKFLAKEFRNYLLYYNGMYDIYSIQYLVIYISYKLHATFAALVSKYCHYKTVYDL